jgi:hypothetical protein
MDYFYQLLIFFCLLTSTLEKLLGFVEIFRHGARTPVRYFNLVREMFSPYKVGDLTPQGMNQASLLGEYIRSTYLSDNIEVDDDEIDIDIKLKSSLIFTLNIPRCINSAISHFQHLFENDLVTFYDSNSIENFKTKFNNNPLNYQDLDNYINNTNYLTTNEIKINILNVNNDKLLGARECFKLTSDFFINEKVDEKDKEILLNLNSTHPFLLEDIIDSNFSILSVKNTHDLIYSTLFHFPNYFNITTPIWNVFNKYKMKYNYQFIKNDDEKKLLTSNLFDMIITMFEGILNEKEHNLRTGGDLSALFLSGRDVNIVDIINNLIDEKFIEDYFSGDIFDERINFFIPPFSSVLIFELHKMENNQFYIKINYNGEENFINLKTIGERKIKYESNGVLASDFLGLLKSRINENYKNITCK